MTSNKNNSNQEAILLLRVVLTLALSVLDAQLLQRVLVASNLDVERQLNLCPALNFEFALLNLGCMQESNNLKMEIMSCPTNDRLEVGQLFVPLPEYLGILHNFFGCLGLNLWTTLLHNTDLTDESPQLRSGPWNCGPTSHKP